MKPDPPQPPDATANATPTASTATSRTLLDRIRAGDSVAWSRLVALYAPLLYAWCRRWGVPREDTADVLQEVFQSVSTRLASFSKDTDGDTFRGWLRVVARNKVCDFFRRSAGRAVGVGGTDAQVRLAQLAEEIPGSMDGSQTDPPERRLLHRALDMIRAEFEDRSWKAFWQTAVDGRAAKDVAADLAMSPGAVRVAKSRVLQRLREEIGDHRGGTEGPGT